MRTVKVNALALAALCWPAAAVAQPPRPGGETRGQEAAGAPRRLAGGGERPALPEGKTLDEVLDWAAAPVPDRFPDPTQDDKTMAFLLVDQLEYRSEAGGSFGATAWEGDAWLGGDFNRLVLKPEGSASILGARSIEAETDALYSRLIAPFWSAQIGAQYALAWDEGAPYTDRWSGAAALQGVAPGKFEIDASIYVSQGLDVTATLEAEYDWRLTQRLVAQPRIEFGASAQQVPTRGLGAGLTSAAAGVRLRYEFWREFAPYLGARYGAKLFGTADRARESGEEPSRLLVLAGLRIALL